jgi:hypothetical protein
MDLQLILTNDGGDLVKNPKDFGIVLGLENMPLLAMFGGNVEGSTPAQRLENQESLDWWGNNLLMPNDASIQFNSETERLLNNVTLNSAGRLLIEETIKNDLSFLNPFARIVVEVRILSVDRISILIKIIQNKSVFIWDLTNKGLVDGFKLVSGWADNYKIFDFSFDFSFE